MHQASTDERREMTCMVSLMQSDDNEDKRQKPCTHICLDTLETIQ